MHPWINTTTSGTTTENATCTPNTTFTYTKSNSGLLINPFTVHLHDDWAGIDTNTVTVIFTGYINNILTTQVYTGSNAVVTLQQFDFPGPWTRNSMTLGTGKVSTGNYTVQINNTTIFDPEDPIEFSITYADRKGKTGTPLLCNYFDDALPIIDFFSPSMFANLMQLSNYPFGAKISPFNLYLLDDWAGVDSGTVQFSITGHTLNPTFDNILPVNIQHNS